MMVCSITTWVFIMQELMLGAAKRIPGPSNFLGEITAQNFVGGTDLGLLIGLTAGTVVNDLTPWLVFVYKGKELYVPKLPIRRSMSWVDLYNRGAVNGDDQIGNKPSNVTGVLQNRRVTFGGKTYRVRLLHGSVNNYPATIPDGEDHASNVGSEWNDLFYQMTVTTPPSYTGSKIRNPYPVADIFPTTNQTYNLTMEINAGTSAAMIRGLTFSSSFGIASGHAAIGWRPCLEVVTA